MSLKKKTINSFIWDFGGRIIGQFFSFTIGIILARLLTPADYGLIGLVLVLVAILRSIADAGLGSSLIQKTDVDNEHFSTVFFTNFVISCFLALSIFLSSGSIANFYDIPSLKPIAQVLSVMFIIDGATMIQRTIFKKHLQLQVITFLTIISSVIGGIIGIAMAYADYGVWSLVVQTIIGSFINSMLLWSKSSWRPNFVWKFEKLKELWTFGFYIFLSTIINSFTSKLNVVLIGKLFTASTLGLYTRAESLCNFIIRFSSTSLASISFPAFSIIKDQEERFKSNFLLVVNLCAFVVFGMSGILYLIAEPLIVFLLTDKWIEAVPIFKILCLSIYAYPLSAVTLSAVTAKGNSSLHFKLNIIKPVISIAGMLIGFKINGLYGYLYSLIITQLLSLVINFAAVKTTVSLSIFSQFKNIIFFAPVSVSLVYIINLFSPIFKYDLMQIIFLSLIFGLSYLTIVYFYKPKSMVFILRNLTNFKSRI